MKIKLLFVALFVSLYSLGQTTLAAWTFPTTSGNAPSTLAAECGAFSASSNLYADGSNGSTNWSAAATRQYLAGNAPSSSLCSVTTATGAYSLVAPASPFNNSYSIVFKLLTTGYQGLILTYWTRGTATGYATHDWSYSTDGTSFTAFSTITGRNSTSFSLQTVDFSAVTALDNVSNVYIRLTVSGATALNGNNRLDNVNFAASPMTACSAPTNQASGLNVSNVTSSAADFSWINAIAATGTVVTIRPVATSQIAPVTLTTYTPNANYALAPETATSSGNRVVYLNTGTSTTITGLGPNTQYTATIYAYNSPNCYNTTSPISVNFTTLAGSCPPTGPLNGTYAIPACFSTIASAVTYLNANGISGSVIFNVAAGYTETAPSGGFNLTATGTITNTITFQKTAGANPVITAYTPQASGTVSNAVFKIVGGDYITIDGFTLQENSSNTITTFGSNNMTEFGIGIFYASTTNGAQNVTIKNCTIDLDRTYTNTFGIYSNSTHTSTNVSTAAYATSLSGSNSNLTFTGNTITDVNMGIVVIGSNTAATFNNGLVIGGSVANANAITNYGTSAPASGFNLLSGTVNGILVLNTTNFTVSYNTVTSSGVATNTTVRGIYIDDYSVAPTGTLVNNVNNNVVNVTSAATNGVDVFGIDFHGAKGNNTTTNNVNNNTVTVAYPTANTGQAIYGIFHGMTSANLNVNNNTIAISTAASTGVAGTNCNIHIVGTISLTININNNTITATLTSAVATTAALRGINCTAGSAACTTSISDNNFNSFDYTGASTWSGALSAIFHNGTPKTGIINNNKFNNLSVKTTGAIYLINNMAKAPNSGTKMVTGNSIVGSFARPAAGNGDFYGYFDDTQTTNTSVTHTVSGNNFSNITISSANKGMLVGVDCQSFNQTGFASSTTYNITNNIISNCTNGSGDVYGIWADGCAGTSAISGNSISNLSNTGSVAPTPVYGIYLGSTLVNPYVDVFNNTILQLKVLNTVVTATSADIAGIHIEGGTNIQIYKNKISGLQTSYTGVATVYGIFSQNTETLSLYNNIIGDLTASSTNVSSSSPSIAVHGISIGPGTTRKVYYNTVYLTGTSSGANFGSCAMFLYNDVSGVPASDVRNNLLINATTPKGTGKAAALLFYSGDTNSVNNSYSTTSNNNLFYSGTPSATNLITTEINNNSVNSDQTLAGFQARISPRDSNSVTETSFNPATYFESVIGSDANYLKPKGSCTSTTAAFNAGTPIVTVSNDFALVARNTTTPDIGAWEFDVGKSWIGTVDSNWGTANNWSPNGVPAITDCVFIKSGTTYPAKVSGDDYKAYALNLTVEDGASLLIDTGITPTKGNSLTVKDFVKVIAPNGSFVINNNSSLIQLTDVVTNNNIGNITYNRTTPFVNGYDYVYWSSPVVGQALSTIYSSPTPGDKYSWDPAAANSNATTPGNWVAPVLGSGGSMINGNGYIVRGSSVYAMPPQSVTGVFTGVPNNGIIPVAITQGGNSSDLDDNWNLVGNPYPSSISCRKFLNNNSSLLIDALYIWRHKTAPAAVVATLPFYYNFVYNYDSDDYDEYNLSGNLSDVSTDYYIGAGQGFFVSVKEGVTGSVTFSNGLRNEGYTNATSTNFFKTSGNKTAEEDKEEFNRIWVDLIKEDGSSPVRTMFGYITGATMQRDDLYDAVSDKGDAVSLYSIANGNYYTIQGRSLPFKDNDKVPMGINILEGGQYKIAIAMVDGLFLNSGQNIYLEDKFLNVVYDLRKSPYEFTTKEGTFNDRFVLRYTSDALSNASFDAAANNLIVVTDHKQLSVTSSIENIREVTVYDVLGRKLSDVNNIDAKQYISTSMFMGQQSLIVKIRLEDGTVETKKVIIF